MEENLGLRTCGQIRPKPKNVFVAIRDEEETGQESVLDTLQG